VPKSILTSPDATVRVAIWDLPTRLFHWLLAGLIALSWWSAEYHDDDVHIWSGIAVLTLLIFRILWGFFGSSTARFANFVRGPKAVFG
jgi:cytochrome b